jgi:hypothetical protein
MPSGRVDVTYPEDFLNVKTDDLYAADRVSWILRHDALLRAEQGDLETACLDLRAAINAGRSLGDQLTLHGYLVRFRVSCMVVSDLERFLAQAEPDDHCLAALQEMLSAEAGQTVPSLQTALRGERALTHRLFDALEARRISLDQLKKGGSPVSGKPSRPAADDLKGVPLFWHMHAQYLKRMTAYMDVPGHPLPEWDERMPAEVPGLDLDALLAQLFTRGVGKVIEAARRDRAWLACAAAALAAERYRRAHGRWPESLADLVPQYLPEPTADPYDGQPLRLRRLDDGLLIYSAGPDGQDDGGNIDRGHPTAAGTDLGFRLWDVDRRRQPPPAGE